MFDVYCEGHGTNVLLTTRQITKFHNGPDGVTVDWRCWCGTTGRMVRGNPEPVVPEPVGAEAVDPPVAVSSSASTVRPVPPSPTSSTAA